MLDHRYQDDSANMVYGYVSSPYGTTNPAGNSNILNLFSLFTVIRLSFNWFLCLIVNNNVAK